MTKNYKEYLDDACEHFIKETAPFCKTHEASYTQGFEDGSGLVWLALERERALSDLLVKAAKDCLWINHCRCDGAYTTRNMHEPNSFCGELDDLFNAVKEYEKVRNQ